MTRLQDIYPDNKIILREVGLRDGLQLVKKFPSTAGKQQWIRDEYAAGVRHFEVGSFLPAKTFPQFADVRDMIQTVASLPGAYGIALTLNERGVNEARRRWYRPPRSTARPTPIARASRPLPTSSDSANSATPARTDR